LEQNPKVLSPLGKFWRILAKTLQWGWDEFWRILANFDAKFFGMPKKIRQCRSIHTGLIQDTTKVELP